MFGSRVGFWGRRIERRHFGLYDVVVASRWSIVDPKIAAWLLDPDHPPVTFKQTLDQWMCTEHKSADQVRDFGLRKS